jgi:hypothetical protein
MSGKQAYCQNMENKSYANVTDHWTAVTGCSANSYEVAVQCQYPTQQLNLPRHLTDLYVTINK